MYPVIESLVSRKLVTKVYEPTYRIDRRPAYYYLSKQGVTTLRRIMEFTESFVHAQYKTILLLIGFIPTMSYSALLLFTYKT